jgi:uncharacterized membrane protein
MLGVNLMEYLPGFILAAFVALIFAFLSFLFKAVAQSMWEVADMLFFLGQVFAVTIVYLTIKKNGRS